MNHRVRTTELLLIFLLSTNSVYTEDIEQSKNETPNEQTKPVEEFFEESSSEDQFSLQSTTTTESTTTIETYRKLTLSMSDKNNISREFRPSVHLGEIKESRISTSPFNNLHHFKFDAEVDPGSYREQMKDFQVVFQPTVQTLQTLQTLQTDHANFHQNSFDQNLFDVESLEEGKKGGMQQNGYVKFQDDALDISGIQYGGPLKDQTFHQQFAHPGMENVGTRYNLVDQQVFPNLEKPVFDQQTTTFFGKPSKFQEEPHKQEVGSFSNVDPLKSPYYAGFYDHQSQQPGLQNFDLFKKPSNGVVYVEESSFMRTRKFPYPIYQPQAGYHEVEFVNDEHSSYPVRKRVSPWKKILHLIGAFLPLGLLIAALTPNIVKVDNATQPNIVLSKLRVADLPVEHKQARFTDAPNGCEERSICDMILAGGDAGSTALQNILWNLATKTSTAMAKESGLQEVFDAVKKKDCTIVPC